MTDWRRQMCYDPVPALLASQNKAIIYFTKCDLLQETAEPIETVWDLPEPQKILHKQLADGSWKKSGKNPAVYPPNHYSLVETFKNFRILIEKYQFTKDQPSIPKAAEFLFSFQTEEGDIRGFIGNQYPTYYTGYVLSLLIKAGYENDPRIDKGMQWLLKIRQDDGGWTVPFLTREYNREMWLKLTSTFIDRIGRDPSPTMPRIWF